MEPVHHQIYRDIREYKDMVQISKWIKFPLKRSEVGIIGAGGLQGTSVSLEKKIFQATHMTIKNNYMKLIYKMN